MDLIPEEVGAGNRGACPRLEGFLEALVIGCKVIDEGRVGEVGKPGRWWQKTGTPQRSSLVKTA